MRNDKILLISLVSIIFFSTFFLFIMFFHNDVILFNSSLKSFTKEYWDWYIDNVNIQGIIVEITSIVKMVFSLIFALELLYISTNDKYKGFIDKKNLFISIAIGFSVNYLITLLINLYAVHYRLYMTLIPTEILSLIVLNMNIYIFIHNKGLK